MWIAATWGNFGRGSPNWGAGAVQQGNLGSGKGARGSQPRKGDTRRLVISREITTQRATKEDCGEKC